MTRIRRKDTLMTDYPRIRVFANDVVSENRGRQSGFRRPEPASARLQPRGKTRSTSAWRPEQVPVPTHTN
jgi:hypothetical protein